MSLFLFLIKSPPSSLHMLPQVSTGPKPNQLGPVWPVKCHRTPLGFSNNRQSISGRPEETQHKANGLCWPARFLPTGCLLTVLLTLTLHSAHRHSIGTLNRQQWLAHKIRVRLAKVQVCARAKERICEIRFEFESNLCVCVQMCVCKCVLKCVPSQQKLSTSSLSAVLIAETHFPHGQTRPLAARGRVCPQPEGGRCASQGAAAERPHEAALEASHLLARMVGLKWAGDNSGPAGPVKFVGESWSVRARRAHTQLTKRANVWLSWPESERPAR